jgi:hypothetical protein
MLGVGRRIILKQILQLSATQKEFSSVGFLSYVEFEVLTAVPVFSTVSWIGQPCT